jgi:general secretion pathway protein J
MTLIKSSRSTNASGFTLLEILIAMFIFGVVLSTIFTSYTGTFRIIEEVESQADIYAMARVALARMQEDLESACSKEVEISETGESATRPFIFLGEDKEIEERDADTLRFFSRAHLNLGEYEGNSDIAEISYYVKQKDEGEALVLYRSDTPELAEPPEEDTGGMVLCDGLFSVNITYYDDEGQAHEDWDSAEEGSKVRLPKRVSIQLEFINEMNLENPHRFMTGFALPMARENLGT